MDFALTLLLYLPFAGAQLRLFGYVHITTMLCVLVDGASRALNAALSAFLHFSQYDLVYPYTSPE